MTDAPEPKPLDLLWGCEAIAAFIGRTPRQTFEAVSKGQLPTRKVNGRWVASKKALREFFEEVAHE
tara:strand:+ start:681 stop:878 length:198 start_codon:yes stop_codon:yes gene_type:complete